jgi:Na+-driven multidrug efflux pump
MVTLCSKHKNDPSKGQIGRGQHHKRRKTIMHGTISGILQALFCVPGGIYRPECLKLNLTPDCQALSRTMTGVWESLSLRIGYAKVVLVGVPELLHMGLLLCCSERMKRTTFRVHLVSNCQGVILIRILPTSWS